MKIYDVEQGTKEWLQLRRGKLTGTNSKYVVGYREMLKADLVGEALERGCEFDEKKVKVDELKDLILERDPDFSFRVMEEKINKDFEYKMLAVELVGSEDGDEEEQENPLERGHSKEPEARLLFEKTQGKRVDEVGFVTLEEEERIGLSPDGLIKNGEKYTEGVEIKCPCAWKYLRSWLEGEVPEEYKEQCLHYFVPAEELERVYLMIYNPRVTIHPFHVYILERKDYRHQIQTLKQAQLDFWKLHDERMKQTRTLADTLTTSYHG